MQKQQWAIGVDIGGTKIAVAAVDPSGEIIDKILFETSHTLDYGTIEQQVIANIQELIHHTTVPPVALGIGVAGQVDEPSGTVIFAPNLNWHNIPIKTNFEKILKLPVKVLNDVRAATWGEWKHGAGVDLDNFVCVFVGTGIGGGIVANGMLMNGSSNAAGELGHIRIDLHGPTCTCGGIGCLEAWSSGWAIAARAQEAVSLDPAGAASLLKFVGGNRRAITAKHVIQAYYEGDPFAKILVDDTTEALIAGVISIVHSFNPSRIILGGGVIHGLPELVDWIADGVNKRALPAATKDLSIVQAQLQGDAVAIGAASYALKRQ